MALMTIGGRVICKAVSISVRIIPLMYSHRVFHIHLPMPTSMERATRKKFVRGMVNVVSHSVTAGQNLLY